MPEQLIILTAVQIQQKLMRIAYQILEDNVGTEALVVAGINERGLVMARRLVNILQEITPARIILVNLRGHKRLPDFTVAGAENKDWEAMPIIIVDDVLDSGTTMSAAFGFLLKNNHPKIRTAVLVDRSHRIYPLAIDFAGLRLSTVINDHVHVQITDNGENDYAYLI